MGEPIPGTPPSAKPPEDRLDSWKEIAAYLNRDVTTVQRWEKREGMPVHRHLHDRMGSVYAFKWDLDAWARSRTAQSAPESGASAPSSDPPPPSSAPGSRLIRWTILLPLAAAAMVSIGAGLWLQQRDYFWRSPIAEAQFQKITDFDGIEQATAVSGDGKYVAFLSDRDGKTDVWVTAVGSGPPINLTHGNAPGELVNTSVRAVGFTPDGNYVTFWARLRKDINIWKVPILGGQPPTLYIEGGAEYDWSRDLSRIAFHPPETGDPLFVKKDAGRPWGQAIFTAPQDLHSHFPLWSPDNAFIYFVQGSPTDNKWDIWRINPAGGSPERITSHFGPVSYPVLLDRRTLMYLASDSTDSGPWLYSTEVERHIPHRLDPGPDRYTSLAASADGRLLAATLARPKKTLWRLPIGGSPTEVAKPAPISLTTSTGSSPRLGHDYLLYVSATGMSESIRKLANGTGTETELWRGQRVQILGGPAISPNERSIAFSVRQDRKTLLYVMQADGKNARIVADSLALLGAPAWSPDGQSITSAAADDHGVPHLFRMPIDGRSPASFVQEYSRDPAWSPDGHFAVYSGPDTGTRFPVKAVAADGAAQPFPSMTLTRGARHLAFLPGEHALLYLEGEIQHKNLWRMELDTGAARQLTNLAPDFDIRDFDVSPDGRDVVLERAQEHSDVVMLTLPRP